MNPKELFVWVGNFILMFKGLSLSLWMFSVKFFCACSCQKFFFNYGSLCELIFHFFSWQKSGAKKSRQIQMLRWICGAIARPQTPWRGLFRFLALIYFTIVCKPSIIKYHRRWYCVLLFYCHRCIKFTHNKALDQCLIIQTVFVINHHYTYV